MTRLTLGLSTVALGLAVTLAILRWKVHQADLELLSMQAGSVPATAQPSRVDRTPGAGTAVMAAVSDDNANTRVSPIRGHDEIELDRDSEIKRLQQDLSSVYPEIGKVFGLSAGETEKFLALLARQTVDRRELQRRGASVGATASGDAEAQVRQGNLSNEAEVAAFLGNKYTRWTEYKASLPARALVRTLQQRLDADRVQDANVELLIGALATHMQGATSATDIATRNEQLVRAAMPYLGTKQADALRSLLEEYRR